MLRIQTSFLEILTKHFLSEYFNGLVWSLKHSRWTGILKIQALFHEILSRHFLSKCIYVHEIFQWTYLINNTFKINWYYWTIRVISLNTDQTFLSKCIYVHKISYWTYLIIKTLKINWYNLNSSLTFLNTYQTLFVKMHLCA